MLPCNPLVLVDSGASHCFLSATVARAAGLVLDTSQRLQERMADGKLHTSQGLARNVWSSSYGHPVLFARKKCGALHLCVDFRSLNANAHLDYYPLPCIDELLD